MKNTKFCCHFLVFRMFYFSFHHQTRLSAYYPYQKHDVIFTVSSGVSLEVRLIITKQIFQEYH